MKSNQILLIYSLVHDAFTTDSNIICFDVSQLSEIYGAAPSLENKERIDRLFLHEYSHILNKKWLNNSGIEIKTLLQKALWECWYEGLGNYFSMSDKWKLKKGKLPEITKNSLNDLYPVFVENLDYLKNITNGNDHILLKSLSRGPFNKKWGAFPVAVWIHIYTHKKDEKKLKSLIQKGTSSVIYLANKYLPKNLIHRFHKNSF